MAAIERRKPLLSQELPHQRAVLKFMVCIAVPAGLVYFAINFSRGLYLLAFLELGYSLIALAFWRHIETTQYLKICTVFVTYPILLLVIMGV